MGPSLPEDCTPWARAAFVVTSPDAPADAGFGPGDDFGPIWHVFDVFLPDGVG